MEASGSVRRCTSLPTSGRTHSVDAGSRCGTTRAIHHANFPSLNGLNDLPETEVAQVVLRAARLAGTTEALRFTYVESSEFTKLWRFVDAATAVAPQ